MITFIWNERRQQGGLSIGLNLFEYEYRFQHMNIFEKLLGLCGGTYLYVHFYKINYNVNIN